MIFLILSILSSAAMALLLRLFSKQRGNRYGLVFGNYLTCVLIAMLMTPRQGSFPTIGPISLLCGIAGGFLFVAGLLSTQASIRANGVTLSTAFSKLGLLVTLAVSILCFRERPSVPQLAGIALVLAALLIIHSEEGEETPPAFSLLLLTTVAVGSADSVAKVFQELGPPDENGVFFLCLFLTASVLSGLLCLWEYRRTGEKILVRELGAGVLVAVPNYYCSYLLLLALHRLPAITVYPAFSVGTILVVMFAGIWFFHEKPGKKQLFGMLVILVSLVLLNL